MIYVFIIIIIKVIIFNELKVINLISFTVFKYMASIITIRLVKLINKDYLTAITAKFIGAIINVIKEFIKVIIATVALCSLLNVKH